MTDRDALLAAITAHPDEDTPRLMYADWLDENGHGKRAAFIRARIESDRLCTTDTAAAAVRRYLAGDFNGRVSWSAVDDDLRAIAAAEKAAAKHASVLTLKGEGLPRVKGVLFAHNDRGFFSRLDVDDTAAFLAHADALFRATPIAHVSLDELTAEQARELVAAGHLGRAREWTLSPDTEPEAIRVLGAHRDAAGVRLLALNGGDEDVTTEQLAALAAGKHWTGLEELELLSFDDTNGQNEAAADLFRRKPFRGLRRLEAWGNTWSDDVAKAVAAHLPELRNLDLAINSITGEGAKALAASRTLKHLRTLDLASCDIADGGGTALITTATLPNLTVLRLSSNSGQTLNRKVLVGPGRGPGLRVLTLDRSEPSEDALAALWKNHAIRGLWYLSVNRCGITDASAEVLAEHFACDRLTRLDLSDNALTARGAKALAAWPGAAGLQWLDLSGNAINESGAKALIASPHLKRLKFLGATGRGISSLKQHFKKAFV